MKVLLLNQTFYPDVAATAQHAADLASELSARGHRVTVIASRRAHDDPYRRLEKLEIWRGVRIVRISQSGFGKASRWRRATDSATFLGACALQLTRSAQFDAVIALTSPPLISLLAVVFTRIRGGRLVYWVLDLNPDEAVAAGWLRADSWIAALLNALSTYTLRAADRVIVLDRFMKERICSKGVPDHKVRVIPPWSHNRAVRYEPDDRLSFRKAHGLTNKFVIMYSGNHSPCHPLDTLLESARMLAVRREFAFCFIGGGSEFQKVREFANRYNLTNVLCLPYQPLSKLSASLSAADLQVVLMGNMFRGIVHPCKIYNILSLGAPVLYVGPAPSHITELVTESAHGSWFYHSEHGSAAALAQRILEAQKSSVRRTRDEIRVAGEFSQEVLIPKLIEEIELTRMPYAVAAGLSLTA